jgi:LysM repeat protein
MPNRMLSICPHLGTAGDWTVACTTPTTGHRCYAQNPPGEPDISYQARFCLDAAHSDCPFYTGNVVPPPNVKRDRRLGPVLRFDWRDIASALAVLVLLVGVLVFVIEQGLSSGREPQITEAAMPIAVRTATLRPSARPTALPSRASQVASPPRATATLSSAQVLEPPATLPPFPTASAQPPATSTVTAMPTVVSPPLVYSARAGDSLDTIAQQHGTTVQALRDANGMINVTRLEVGQLLLIAQPDANAATPLPAAPASFTASAVTNVRRGPGTDYPTIGRLFPGDSYRLLARNTDASWLQFRYAALSGWVAAAAVDVTGDPTALLIAAHIAPPSTLIATPTEPVPTFTAAP